MGDRVVTMDEEDPLDYMLTTVVADDALDSDDDADQAEGQAQASDDSEDEDSSDSDSEGEIGEEELAAFRARVEGNPMLYDAHVQLVAALRSLEGQETALRQAREKMASIFPLPEEEWLEWLGDEERQAARDPMVKIQLLSLYEQAMQDYRSVALWERYARFAEDFHREDPAAVRAVYEEALTAVGLHVAEGSRIWNAYREFELKQGDNERINKLFIRQLSVPLIGMESTLQAYTTWAAANGIDPSPGRRAYESASARLEEYLPFEQQVEGPWSVTNPDYAKLEEWRKYLQFEEQKNEPARVQMLYERVLQRYCLVPDLWLSYLAYLDRVLRDVHDVVLSVHRRAVRNYPWSSQLWSDYILALERASRTEQEVRAVFEKSLQAGMVAAEDFVNVFQTYTDFLRRRLSSDGQAEEKSAQIRETLQRAIDTLTTYFPESEWITEMRVYWGTLEFRVFADVEKAVAQWEDVVRSQGSDADRWRHYADCMWAAVGLPGIDKVRSIYKRAANSLSNSAAASALFNAWLLFERIYGDLPGFEEARRRQTAKLTQLVTREQKQYEQQQQQQEYLQQRTASRQKQSDTKGKGKRKAEAKPQQDKPSKRRKGEEGVSDEDKPVAAEAEAMVTDPQAQESRASDSRPSVAKGKEKAEGRQAPTTDGSKRELRTVRLSNVPVEATEDDLQKAFEECGPVFEVRIVRGKNRESKGLAFVEFCAVEAVEAALKQERSVMGRTLKVEKHKLAEAAAAEASEAKGKKARTYNDALTVFVSNLAFEMTEEEIREVFGALGPLKAVRLIRDHKQRSKGYAYVQYETQEALEKALQLDQKTVHGRVINVARSRPPKPAPSAGGSSPQFVQPTKPVTAFTPRALKRPGLGFRPGASSSTSGAEQSSSSSSASSSSAQASSGPKSNAQFRALLSRGKPSSSS